MEVTVNTEMRGYVAPAVPTVELEDANKPQVQPVPASSEGVTVKLNDQALHGKGAKEAKGEKEKSKLSQEELEDAVDEIQKRFDSMGSSFRFGLYEHLETKSIVAQLRNKQTGEVVKQFPSEEILKLRTKLKELVGFIFDEKV